MKIPKTKKINKCRLCSNKKLTSIYKFGSQYVSNFVQLILINNLNAPNIRYFSLFILIFSGIISYIFFINLFGVISKKDIRKFIKK